MDDCGLLHVAFVQLPERKTVSANRYMNTCLIKVFEVGTQATQTLTPVAAACHSTTTMRVPTPLLPL